MSTTTYENHWAEALNVTVNDLTGGIQNTGGGGAGFDASARVEQMFDGLFTLVCEFTINTTTAMAFGIYSQGTTYTPGAVTMASVLAGWEINGGDALVKESGTTRATEAGVSISDVFRVTLNPTTGALTYHRNGVLVFTSAITAATMRTWRPWRVVATFSAANAELTPCTITGESDEYYDPDVASNRVVMDQPLTAEFETAAAAEEPYARAFVS
jgi:hypothetical protein